jgi:prepilin-type N-terminal cleavage/methylation domain-containing protein
MKIQAAILTRKRRSPAQHGFTLAEILIASTIFVLLVAGILGANLFGLQMFQMTSNKLNATRWSRETIMRLTDEVHVCTSAQVGMVTNGLFTAFLDGELQQGNALYINPTTDTNQYVLYFLDTDDQTFRRTTDQLGSAVILASSVTNLLPFTAQDLYGNILTNNLNNQVIHVSLEFYQPEQYLQRSDYYRLETSVKQRIVP